MTPQQRADHLLEVYRDTRGLPLEIREKVVRLTLWKMDVLERIEKEKSRGVQISNQ